MTQTEKKVKATEYKHPHKLRLKDQRKADGVCTRCGKVDVSNTEYVACAKCLDRSNQLRKKRRSVYNIINPTQTIEYRIENGLCTVCGKKNRYKDTQRRCKKCTERERKNTRERRAKRRAEGLCQTCARPLEDKQFVNCKPCREYQSAQNKKLKEKRIEKGIYDISAGYSYRVYVERGMCGSCGKVPPKEGVMRCEPCLEKSRLKQRKHFKYVMENNLCRGCKRKLPDDCKYVKCDSCRRFSKKYSQSEKTKERHRRRRQRYKELHLCASCSTQLTGSRINKTLCSKCAKKSVTRGRKRAKELYEEVKCTTCGKSLTIAEAKYRNCASCRKRALENKTRDYQIFKEKNLCVRCGEDRQNSGILVCPKCREKQIAQSRARRAYKKNPKKCTRCDAILSRKESKWKNCSFCRSTYRK